MAIPRGIHTVSHIYFALYKISYSYFGASIVHLTIAYLTIACDSVHVHGISMSKDALNKVRYLCLSNCLNDEMLEKPCTGVFAKSVPELTVRLSRTDNLANKDFPIAA